MEIKTIAKTYIQLYKDYTVDGNELYKKTKQLKERIKNVQTKK